MTGVLKRGDQDMDTCLEVRPSKDIGSIWASISQGERPGTDPSFMALKRNQIFELILMRPTL